MSSTNKHAELAESIEVEIKDLRGSRTGPLTPSELWSIALELQIRHGADTPITTIDFSAEDSNKYNWILDARGNEIVWCENYDTSRVRITGRVVLQPCKEMDHSRLAEIEDLNLRDKKSALAEAETRVKQLQKEVLALDRKLTRNKLKCP